MSLVCVFLTKNDCQEFEIRRKLVLYTKAEQKVLY